MKIKLELNKGIKVFGLDRYNTSIKVKDLLNIYEVPYYKVWSGSIKDGYQRGKDNLKIDSIRDKSLKTPDDLVSFMTDLVLNIRVPDATTYLKKVKGFNNFYTFDYIDKLGPGYVVDGQHRVEGLYAAYTQAKKSDPTTAKKLEDQYINILITFTDDIYLEAYSFYLINNHAKKVSTEGAHRLLVDGVNNGNVNFINELGKISRGYIECANIVDNFSNNSPVWANRVKDFNEKAPEKPITATALTKLVEMIWQTLDLTNTTNIRKATEDITEAYWEALSDIFPIMFKVGTYRNYNILKASQAEVMFMVLRDLIKLDQGGHPIGNLTQKNTWKNFMYKTLKSFTDHTTQGAVVKGEQCWLVGSMKGSMGNYTSSQAKGDIAKKLFGQVCHDNSVPGF